MRGQSNRQGRAYRRKTLLMETIKKLKQKKKLRQTKTVRLEGSDKDAIILKQKKKTMANTKARLDGSDKESNSLVLIRDKLRYRGRYLAYQKLFFSSCSHMHEVELYPPENRLAITMAPAAAPRVRIKKYLSILKYTGCRVFAENLVAMGFLQSVSS